MRYLLALLFFSVTACDVLGWTQSIAPGMSVKNAFIYIAALSLAARFVIRGGFKLDVPSIQLWLGVLVTYAILTWLVVGVVLHYQSYKLVTSGIDLKSELLDNVLMFLLCLYGTQSVADVKFVTKWLLIAVTGANAIAIGDIAGWFQIGVTMVGKGGAEAGRAFGAFGHANETAALIICLLPAYAAAAISSAGIRRPFWIAAALISTAMMLMNGSRGAFVGLVLGGALGWYTCRRIISFRKAVPLLIVLAVLVIPVLLLVGMEFNDVLTHRVIAMLQDPGSGSGRTLVWLRAINTMMEHPLTLLTGFGWDAYSVMGFDQAMHNHYLLLWFELGVIGVVSYLLAIQAVVVTARSAAAVARPEHRAYLVACIFGVCFMSVAVFFTLLFRPWLYIWAYLGVSMRLAVMAVAEVRIKAEPEPAATRAPGAPRELAGRSLPVRGG